MGTAIVYDLGYGDAGKGSIVDFLCRETNANLVVRFSGGPQNAHNVITEEGIHHTFHQYGSGALAGVPTHITEDVIVEPRSLLQERDRLCLLRGNTELSIDYKCLISTDYHSIVNKMKEIERGRERHGTCGWGINETVQFDINHRIPRQAITAMDFITPQTAKNKLSYLYEYCCRYLERNNIEFDVPSVDIVWDSIEAGGELIAKSLHMLQWLPKTTIFEGSQGVLLDQHYGFFPHVTRANTTPANAQRIIKFHGQVPSIIIGVTRTYATRHGDGPFVTEDSLPMRELHNLNDPWQGRFRKGWLDMVALRYALDVAPCNVLAVTCIDEVDELWFVSNGYYYDGVLLDSMPKPIEISTPYRQAQTEFLYGCTPQLRESLNIIREIEKMTNTVVGIKSYGPKSSDKEWVVESIPNLIKGTTTYAK